MNSEDFVSYDNNIVQNMLEAPEALFYSGQLNNSVKGKKITVVLAGHTPHKFTWFYGKPEAYEAKLTGKIMGTSRNLGGMIETDIDDMVLVLTDGSNIKYLRPGEKIPEKHQLLIGFEDESCLVVSVRMYGGIVCSPKDKQEGNFALYYESAKTKPQVMSGEFSEEYFQNLIRSTGTGKVSVKALLATGQSIPGLGNGVLQDILYNAHIHPKTKAEKLDDEEIRKLYFSVRNTLKEIFEQGGRHSEKDIYGKPGNYKPFLCKDTAGLNCVRCGDLIIKENYLGGAIYYCPQCQKLR